MKKFLSLLLALTLVLSLVVVPARATDAHLTGYSISPESVSADATEEVTFTVSGTPVLSGVDNATLVPDSTTYEWSDNVTPDTSNPNIAKGSFSANATVTCTVKVKYTVSGSQTQQEVSQQLTRNVTKSTFEYKDIDLTIKDRSYTPSSTVNVTLIKASGATENPTIAQADIRVTPKSGSKYTVKSAVLNDNGTTLTVTGQRNGVDVSPTLNITINSTVNTPSTTIAAAGSVSSLRSGQTVTLSATYSNGHADGITYTWNATAGKFSNQSGNTVTWTAPEVSTNTPCKITCTVRDDGVDTTSNELPITATKDNYKTHIITPRNSTSSATNKPVEYQFNFRDYTSQPLGTEISLKNTQITWSVSGGNATFSNGSRTYTAKGTEAGIASAILNTGSTAASSIAVVATFDHGNKTYTVTFPTISVITLTATLDSTYYNAGARNYTSRDLISPADSAVKSYAGAQLSVGEYVNTVTINTTGYNAGYLGTFSGVSSTAITFTPTYNQFGKATFTGTATTNLGKSFAITFSIPVTPVPVNSFDSQTAEPVSTTTVNTNYKVSAPYGYTKFYVLNNSYNLAANQIVDYSQYSVSQLNSMGYAYTTIPSTYFGTSGQCTLNVIAWNDSANYTNYSKYYCGPMTVTQTNYNINYNGVAGETVQFAQSDFTDFMNEVAEARGDASKTKSYPYVTFDYVTFSLPTTAQGTLYYGGTAMSTSNSSGAFNRNTKVTNLDSVTFVPNAKTTAKTITLNFTLYATRYSSSSTSRGTTVSYSGSVVVNLVREDIKYTVSQGDSVRFDESDFLSYLRSTKGYSSNYTIDYVTFDQSAVSAVNEGSLYTYYNGYNYGGSVKTTDRFYYNATASQNALSDVAFLASRYAKTGETVYIPFTIYARYGTTGTGTRQLTGTVAIKIGQTMNFIDVKTTDYFYNSVKWAVGKNITNGTSSTTFSPYKSCTRAEIVTFLWRAAGSPEPTITRNPFRDVNAVTHSSYYKAILWASQKGITSGTSATAFSPDQVCTRAQIVTFLYRYAGQPSGYYSNPFKDVSATNEASYYNAILWAVGKGITTGTSATTFSPYASCNRAEAVTFLYRYTNGL